MIKPNMDNVKIINVSQPWFSHIVCGSKTIEGRLNTGKFKQFMIGDIMKVCCDHLFVYVKINDIVHYKSFEDLLNHNEINKVLPKVGSVQKGVEEYRKFYKMEQETQYGVLAIHFNILSKIPDSSNTGKCPTACP